MIKRKHLGLALVIAGLAAASLATFLIGMDMGYNDGLVDGKDEGYVQGYYDGTNNYPAGSDSIPHYNDKGQIEYYYVFGIGAILAAVGIALNWGKDRELFL